MFQKCLARPISKLLNPFAEGRGYSLAVALNFTQTKMKMPKTKQSSISAFFTSQRRGKLFELHCHIIVFSKISKVGKNAANCWPA